MAAFKDHINGVEKLLPFFDQQHIPVEIDNLELLRVWLAKELENLSSTDFSRFLQLLYRIDVEEKKVKEIIELSADPFVELADLIFQREAQKQYWRAKFKSSKNINDDNHEKWD